MDRTAQTDAHRNSVKRGRGVTGWFPSPKQSLSFPVSWCWICSRQHLFVKSPCFRGENVFFIDNQIWLPPPPMFLSKLPRLPMVRDWPSQFFGLFPRALCRYGPTMPLRIRFVLVDERPQHQRTSSQEAKWSPRCPPGRPENRGLHRFE